MADNVLQFAKDALKAEMKRRLETNGTVGKTGEFSWRRFKHLYHVGNDINATDDIDEAIDSMPYERVNWAMRELGYIAGRKG